MGMRTWLGLARWLGLAPTGLGLGLALGTLGLLGTWRRRRRSGDWRGCRRDCRKFVLASCPWPLRLALGARVLIDRKGKIGGAS